MAAVNPPGNQVPPVPPAPGPVFALTPAALHTAAFIDLNTTEGRKSFNTAIKPLEEVYDGAKTGLQMFIHQVSTRSAICGWDASIMTIPSIGDPNVTHSLLTQYGQIPLPDIVAHASVYLPTPTKIAQDSTALKLFLDSSLSTALMMRVLAKRQEYTVGGVESGPAMFRVILSTVGIDTVASVAVINAVLRTLPAKLSELKSDIVAFNEFVTEQCNELTSRGHQPSDLLNLLFEAYLSASNEHFKEYMRSKESAVYDGTLMITYQALMTIAEDRYKIMKIKGEWKAGKATPTTDDHIIALRAEIQALQAATSTAKRATPAGAASGNTNAMARKTNTGKWAWKDKEPKATEPLIKMFEGRKYCHCPNHKSTKWVLADKHQDGCTLDANWKFPAAKDTGADKPKPAAANQTYAAAMMHVISEDEANQMMDEDDEENA